MEAKMKQALRYVLLPALVLLSGAITLTQDAIELRFLCFNERNECEVYEDLLARYSQENPGVTVSVHVAAEAEIEAQLNERIELGAAPDIARIADFDAQSSHYLDLRPFLRDAEAFAGGFQAPFLAAMRAGAGAGIHGFPDTAAMVAPFVNVTLFDEAGVSLPEAGSDWEKWLSALEEVEAKTGVAYLLAVDNKDHRLVGPAMSLGARYFDEDGALTLADDLGLRAFLQILQQLLAFERAPADTLLGTDAAQDYFTRGETVMYICGSWKVEEVAAQVGGEFDWAIVPNPAGPAGGTGVAKATALVALAATDQPEAVASVLEYLAQPEIYAEFSARTLTIPAQLEVAASTINYDTENETIDAAMNAFAREAPKLQDQAIALDQHPLAAVYYAASNELLRAYFAGELTLDEALGNLKAQLVEAGDA